MEHNGEKVESYYHDGVEVQKWTHNGVVVYEGLVAVTLIEGSTKRIIMAKKNSTITPAATAVSGATFVGWSTNRTTTASKSFKVNGPMTVYRVIKYNNAVKSVSCGGGQESGINVSINQSMYPTINVAVSADASYRVAILRSDSTHGYVDYITTTSSAGSTINTPYNGVYSLFARSNYAGSGCTAILTMYGKTVVG